VIRFAADESLNDSIVRGVLRRRIRTDRDQDIVTTTDDHGRSPARAHATTIFLRLGGQAMVSRGVMTHAKQV